MDKLPFHVSNVLTGTSEMEIADADGTVTTMDPERAHTAAGDPGFQTTVPECGLCQAQALAKKRAKEQEALDDQSETT